jgi:hypothetical protein
MKGVALLRRLLRQGQPQDRGEGGA